jgi:hypothetical protein
MKRIKIGNIKNQIFLISLNPKQYLESSNNKITITYVIFFQQISLLDT